MLRRRCVTAFGLEPWSTLKGSFVQSQCDSTVVRFSMLSHTSVGFCDFLKMHARGPQGQEFPIGYTSCLYRQEQLPRSLLWDTVRAFLDGIDPRSGTAGLARLRHVPADSGVHGLRWL